MYKSSARRVRLLLVTDKVTGNNRPKVLDHIVESTLTSKDVNIARALPGSDPAEGACAEKLSREAINSLPLFHYTGQITLVRTSSELDEAIRRLRESAENGLGQAYPPALEESWQNGALLPVAADAAKPTSVSLEENGNKAPCPRQVLGFDTETKPSFRKGKSYMPSLIQLALADEVILFHLKWVPLDERLLSIFEDPAIIKTGVAVHEDMRSLAKLLPFSARSVIDLGEVACRNKIENRGLRGLAAFFLGLRISKGEQCSNWGNSALSPRQIRYAATDAWISRAIYFRMREMGMRFDGLGSLPFRPRTVLKRSLRKAGAVAARQAK